MRYLTGFHAIEEAIKAGAKGPLLVAKAGPRARALAKLAADNGVRVNRSGEHELDRLARDHRGIALAVDDGPGSAVDLSVEEFLQGLDDADEAEGGSRRSALVLVLDGITDPHNYGAILRSCDQFGADLVVAPSRRSAKDSETVARTSSGASAWVPTAVVPNLVRAVALLKDAGFWVYGADMGGSPVDRIDLSGRVVLVMGSEGTGISRLLRESCDGTVAIPSYGRVDSLNVSVAAGVLLYEARRQRRASEAGTADSGGTAAAKRRP